MSQEIECHYCDSVSTIVDLRHHMRTVHIDRTNDVFNSLCHDNRLVKLNPEEVKFVVCKVSDFCITNQMIDAGINRYRLYREREEPISKIWIESFTNSLYGENLNPIKKIIQEGHFKLFIMFIANEKYFKYFKDNYIIDDTTYEPTYRDSICKDKVKILILMTQFGFDIDREKVVYCCARNGMLSQLKKFIGKYNMSYYVYKNINKLLRMTYHDENMFNFLVDFVVGDGIE